MKKFYITLALLLITTIALSQQIKPYKSNATLDSTGYYEVKKVVKRGNMLLLKLGGVKGWFWVAKKYKTKVGDAIFVEIKYY